MQRSQFDDPDLPLENLMSQWPATIPVFLRRKMLCVGCLVNPFHTVEDACLEYNLDEDSFRDELWDAVLITAPHR